MQSYLFQRFLVSRHFSVEAFFSTTFPQGYHSSSCLFGSPRRRTRFERIADHNKTVYIHRNSEFGPQPIFYRGPKRIDLWQRYLDKIEEKRKWETFSRQVDVGDSPVDDVYLTTLYKSRPLGVMEAIERLKEYTLLDFTDQESPIRLQLKLVPVTMKTISKKKRPFTFFNSTPLPHPTGKPNKLCLFTTNEAVMESATQMGLHAVGGHDIVTKVMNNLIKADGYFCTPEFVNEISGHSDLKKKLGGMLPHKRFNMVEDPQTLDEFLHNTIVHNIVDPTLCDVTVGEPRQGAAELEANVSSIIRHLDALMVRQKVDKFVESASLSCHTEPILLDCDALMPDDV